MGGIGDNPNMDTIMKCAECSKRNNCTELCKEVEEYANQDYVPQIELPIGHAKYSLPFPDLISNIYLTKTEKKIVRLLGSGLSRQEVSQVLGITIESIYMHISRMRKKV